MRAALAEIPSRRRPRARKGNRFEIGSPFAHQAEEPSDKHEPENENSNGTSRGKLPANSIAQLFEYRTFLCIAPQLRASESVVQSTTEATEATSKYHYAYDRGINPRRYFYDD